MAGKFVIKQSKTGYRFNLKAGNNEIIGTSEDYTTLDKCKNGIESVRKNSATGHFEDQTVDGYITLKNPKFEIFKDKANEFRFRLKATNGEIILQSEGYTTLSGCKNGIESVIKNAIAATVDEEY